MSYSFDALPKSTVTLGVDTALALRSPTDATPGAKLVRWDGYDFCLQVVVFSYLPGTDVTVEEALTLADDLRREHWFAFPASVIPAVEEYRA